MNDWRFLLLRTPTYRRFWIALLVHNLGSWCVIAALPILVAQRFGAGEELVLSLAARVLPKILLAPLAGRALQRFGATRQAGLALAGLGALTALVPLCGDFVQLQALIVLIGTLDVFIGPALMSLRGPLTPEGREMAGNTLCSVADRLAKILGPALGASVLIAGFPLAFALFGLAPVTAGILLRGLPDIPPDPNPSRSAVAMALRFLDMPRRDRRIVGLLIAALTYMVLLGGLRPFLFWANRDWYGLADTGWTGLLVAQGVGALAGAALAGLFSAWCVNRVGAYALTLITGILEAWLLLLLVLAPGPVWAMAILALASAPEIISTASWFTAFQQRLSPSRQGVFFAFAGPLWDIAYVGGVSLGALYTSGITPLAGYWVIVTLTASLPLIPLLLSAGGGAAGPRDAPGADPPPAR
jgi:hypothetical protein